MKPKEIAKLIELIKNWDGEEVIFNHGSEKDLAVYISERLFVDKGEIKIDDREKASN